VFGIGEHTAGFSCSAPIIMLPPPPSAPRPSAEHGGDGIELRRSGAVYEQFFHADLLSNGRAEIMAGRGSFIEFVSLFGYNLTTTTRCSARSWSCCWQFATTARHLAGPTPRAAARSGRLSAHAEQDSNLGRGRRQSAIAIRAGSLNLPMALAIIVACRSARAVRQICSAQAASHAGHDADKLPVGINTHGYCGETSQAAADEFFPSYAAQMTHIGKERAGRRPTREHFDGRPFRHAAILRSVRRRR